MNGGDQGESSRCSFDRRDWGSTAGCVWINRHPVNECEDKHVRHWIEDDKDGKDDKDDKDDYDSDHVQRVPQHLPGHPEHANHIEWLPIRCSRQHAYSCT